MKKYLFAFAVALVLCVPAFATDYSNYFTDDFYIASVYNDYCTATSLDDGVYFCLIQSDQNNPRYDWYALSNSSGSSFSRYNHWTTPYGTTTLYCNSSTGNGFYYNKFNFMSNYNSTLTRPSVAFPYGTSVSDIASAFSEFLSSSGGGSLPTSFTVPRGNVLYFQVSSNSDVTFESHFSENSGLFSSSNVYGPWGDTYQRISSESSLPGAGIEFPRTGSSAIVWEKGDPLNVLGQTKTGVYTDTFQTGTYYAFYNPAYQSITSSDGFGSASVGSNVTVSGNFSFIRIYSLQQIYDISTSTNDYDDYYVGTPDDDGGVTWVDQDDQISYPSSGGENQEDEPISSVSLIESIKRILRNILNEIESIFTFGFSAIRDLVDLMDEFVATFDDLYEWLPEECYTLLIACVSVAIAIGVFKVFL